MFAPGMSDEDKEEVAEECGEKHCLNERTVGPVCRPCYEFNLGVPADVVIAELRAELDETKKKLIDKIGDYFDRPDCKIHGFALDICPDCKKEALKLLDEAHTWLDRLLQRDGISLDCDRTDSTPTGEDEMKYTINFIDRMGKFLYPKKSNGPS